MEITMAMYENFIENCTFEHYRLMINSYRLVMILLIIIEIRLIIKAFTVLAFRVTAKTKKKLKRIAKLRQTKLEMLLPEIVEQYIDHYTRLSGMDLDLPKKIKKKRNGNLHK